VPAVLEAPTYGLKQYVPLVSETVDWLNSNAMPVRRPDGRMESPGVLRIYVASMVCLAVFYTLSLVVGAFMQGVRRMLEALGIVSGKMGEAG